MRTLIVVLVGLALLVAGPAGATDNGTGDTHGLIASAAIQPFWSLGADNTLIEVTSPLDENDLHIIYFDSTCKRLTSRYKYISYKGAIMFSPDADNINVTGLAVIAAGGKSLVALSPIRDYQAIHVLGHWVNLGLDFVRVIDPIAVNLPETGYKWGPDRQHYSPLRSAASFGAPLEAAPGNTSPFSTTIFLICPGPNILGSSGVLSPQNGFGVAPKIAYKEAALGLIFANMYSGSEQPKANYNLECNCSSMFELDQLAGGAYTSAAALGVELVSYTELYTYTPPLYDHPPKDAFDPLTFTGYRGIIVNSVAPLFGSDDFGRLHNGSAYNYRVNGADPGTGGYDPFGPPPFFVPGLR